MKGSDQFRSNNKLGYTWYPKDFISDPEVMFMSAAERGVYRDLIDIAYMNDNEIRYTGEMLAKYTNSDIETIEKVLAQKGKVEEFGYSIPSCQKRMGIIERNRQNGAKGGRPKNENSSNSQTKDKPKNPKKTQTEIQTIDSKIENRKKRESFFFNELITFVESEEKLPGTYPKEMVREFYDYWSEPTHNGSKMRKENEKTWDTARRLNRWYRNDSSNNKNQITTQDEQQGPTKRIEEQRKQLFGE